MVMVNITITDVNEPPAVDGTDNAADGAELIFNEKLTGDINTPLDDLHEANNPEDNVMTTLHLVGGGADGGKFDISTNGALTFKVKPDYEMPTDANTDNVYEVTVRAADADRNIGTMAVKVSVTNEDEDGTVTLSKIQPRVGVAVTASVTDPDGSISGLTWQWYGGNIDVEV